MELMEKSLNIRGLIDLCVQLLLEVSENVSEKAKELLRGDKNQKMQRPVHASNYLHSLVLCTVSVFWKYHTYLVHFPETLKQACKG